MTTLAIIGGGIAGRSLIYALAKQKKTYSKIFLFDADSFAHTCSLRSTAIVAGRGVSAGHSSLGDLLLEGFQTFSQHVAQDRPEGVFHITQYTGANQKMERYPEGELAKEFGPLRLNQELYLAREAAFLIDTKIYLNWLLQSADVSLVEDFVVEVDGKRLKTLSGHEYAFDHLVFAGGKHNQNWSFKTPAKTVQGSYLEFRDVDFGVTGFSATINGDNLVYHGHSKTLLMGSTSQEVLHEWAQRKKLKELYDRLTSLCGGEFPAFEQGSILTGLREKASKRAPYLVTEGSYTRIGGLYKNGFSLSLHLGQQLATSLGLLRKED